MPIVPDQWPPPTPGCGNSLVVVCLCFLTWHRVGPLRSFYPLVLLSCFCSLQFHLSTTFLCARFIACGSRMSTSIDEFQDYPGSNPFVSNIPMCLLHCSWPSHLYLQFHLSTTFLCARFIARGSRMSTSIDEFRDYPGSIPFVSNIPMCLLHCSWLSHLYLY